MALDHKLQSWLETNAARCIDVNDILALREYIHTLPVFQGHYVEVISVLADRQLEIENAQAAK